MNNSQRYDKLRGRATEEKPIDTSMMYGTGQHFSANATRSEEHTSELQSRLHLVCRLLLEKKKRERLIVVRMIVPLNPATPTDVADIRLEDYRPVAGRWLAVRVEIMHGGQGTQKDWYSDSR